MSPYLPIAQVHPISQYMRSSLNSSHHRRKQDPKHKRAKGICIHRKRSRVGWYHSSRTSKDCPNCRLLVIISRCIKPLRVSCRKRRTQDAASLDRNPPLLSSPWDRWTQSRVRTGHCCSGHCPLLLGTDPTSLRPWDC